MHQQLQKYIPLPQRGKVIAEYVWIDASGGTRSKSKVSSCWHTHTHRPYRGLVEEMCRIAGVIQRADTVAFADSEQQA